MTACNCVNPSGFCPCHRHYDGTPQYPYWYWPLPVPQPRQPHVTVTKTANITYQPKPDIPALRPEDV